MHQKQLQSNIWKYTVHLVTNKRAYMTLLSIYFLTFPDATTKLVGLLTLVGQVLGFIFEIPSGYISDKLGHKKALVISRFAILASTLCYVFADGVGWFFIGSIALAIGSAFMSGTGTALMHDTISSLGREKEYSKIMGRIRSIGFFIPIIFILVIPILAELYGYQVAFMVMAVIDLIGLISVALMRQPNREVAHEIEEISSDTSGWRSILREYLNAGWLRYVIPTVLILGIYMGTMRGFKNPYQVIVGFPVTFLGVLWALSRVMISGILLFNQRIYDALSYSEFVLARIVCMSFFITTLGLVSNKWIIATLFILMSVILLAFRSADDQYKLEYIKGSRNKATLISINSLVSQLVIGFVGLAMGFLVFHLDYQMAFLIMGIVSFVAVVLGWFFGLRRVEG